MIQVKERPILFSGPMVRAILEGRKSKTRRLVKFHTAWTGGDRNCEYMGRSDNWEDPGYVGVYQFDSMDGHVFEHIQCPQGFSGDRLWVRETCFIWGRWSKSGLTKSGRQRWRFKAETPHTVVFDAAHPQVATKPTPRERCMYWRRNSIHMPRWASRITLEITDVRVERLQDISEEDAIAEGVESPETERYDHDFSICARCAGTCLYIAFSGDGGAMFDTDCTECDTNAKRFRHLWNSINGKKHPWKTNPFVWVIGFRRVQ